MDIRTLKYFLAAAQEKNITRAAEKLCMAQPPLSRQLRLLEEELGVTLIIRGKRQLQLTAEGYFLKQRAEELTLLLDKTRLQLQSMSAQEHGTVSIGATETCGAGILCALLSGFHEAAPHVQFQIRTGNGDELQERLEKNLVDAAIIREPFPMENYDRVFLKREPWAVLLRRDHPLAADMAGIELGGLGQEPLIIPARELVQNEIHNWFNEIFSERNVFCSYTSITSVLGLAERGLGIILCPETGRDFIRNEALVCRRLIRPEHESRVFLVRKRLQVMTSASEKFWNYALQYAQPDGNESVCV